MKWFIVFFLLFSFFSHGNFHEGETDTEVELKDIQNQIHEDVKTLLLTLVNESTSQDHKVEIIEHIREIVLFNKDIMNALNQVVIQSKKCREKREDCPITDIAGLKAQAEIIRRKIAGLEITDQKEFDVYLNLGLDVAMAIVGGVLITIPVGGPVVAIPLLASRSLNVVKTLGSLVTVIGGTKATASIWKNFLKEDEQKTLSLIPELVFREPLLLALFERLVSVEDNSLRIQLGKDLISSGVEKDVIDVLLRIIKDFKDENVADTVELRKSAIQALTIFYEEIQFRKTEIINLLTGIIDSEDEDKDIKETSIVVLGKIAVGNPRVINYLRKKGEDGYEDINIRFLSIMGLARNKSEFSNAVKMLGEWIVLNEGRGRPVSLGGKIPDYFLESFLPARKTSDFLIQSPPEPLKSSYIVVLRELIKFGSLDLSFQVRASETLMSWDPHSSSLFLHFYGIFPKEDILTDVEYYVEEFSRKHPESSEAYQNIQEYIISLREKNLEPLDILEKLEFFIRDMKNDFQTQEKFLTDIENFISSYREIWVTSKKVWSDAEIPPDFKGP